MTGMRALSLLASFLALWARTAMLLSRLPWFRYSVSLAERRIHESVLPASSSYTRQRVGSAGA